QASLIFPIDIREFVDFNDRGGLYDIVAQVSLICLIDIREFVDFNDRGGGRDLTILSRKYR
uniref:Uncharacterized protein n=1 Tax=Parascaris univalens TaxID=6257 RepID=A0A915AKV9_PARUN